MAVRWRNGGDTATLLREGERVSLSVQRSIRGFGESGGGSKWVEDVGKCIVIPTYSIVQENNMYYVGVYAFCPSLYTRAEERRR